MESWNRLWKYKYGRFNSLFLKGHVSKTLYRLRKEQEKHIWCSLVAVLEAFGHYIAAQMQFNNMTFRTNISPVLNNSPVPLNRIRLSDEQSQTAAHSRSTESAFGEWPHFPSKNRWMSKSQAWNLWTLIICAKFHCSGLQTHLLIYWEVRALFIIIILHDSTFIHTIMHC